MSPIRYSIDSVEKQVLQTALDSLQSNIQIKNRSQLVERLESITRMSLLRFTPDNPNTNSIFISSDMFYLEITLDPQSGRVDDVKVSFSVIVLIGDVNQPFLSFRSTTNPPANRHQSRTSSRSCEKATSSISLSSSKAFNRYTSSMPSRKSNRKRTSQCKPWKATCRTSSTLKACRTYRLTRWSSRRRSGCSRSGVVDTR